MSTYQIAGGSLNQTPFDWANNVQNIKASISLAKENDVDILCLPELAVSGYGCEDLFLSNWLPEKALSFVTEIAAECDNILVAVGLPVRFERHLYNCVCVIRNKNILGFTAKQYMANDGVHYEPRWFTPWETGVVKALKVGDQFYKIGDIIYEFDQLKIGFEICEDAWRGKNRPACRLFEKKVNLILNPSASHFALQKTYEREDLIINSSKLFQCTYVYANLLGNEAGRMIYDGEILIAQEGKLIQKNKRLSFQDVSLAQATIDINDSTASQATIQPDFKDKNNEFVQAGSLALFDYLRKSKNRGFVLSLSGGADSSICAVLVAEMVRRGIHELGIEVFMRKLKIDSPDFTNLIEKTQTIKDQYKIITKKLLTCVYQSTKNSSQETLRSAKELANELGARFYQWEIDDLVSTYTKKIERALDHPLNWNDHDIALQNIQARSRAPGIWLLANLKNALLITTSNRSEGDVGYTTMDGDTCGSIAPIAAIDKNFIINWLKWAQKELAYNSLSYVNGLSPSAELRPHHKHQTDEEDLMPYAVITEIEKLAIKDHKSPVEVFQILSEKDLESAELLKSHIIKFYRLWSHNQWKRERIAPSFHLDDFNIDPKTWCRFPILSASFEDELSKLEVQY